MGMEEGRASRGPRGLSGQPLRRAMTPLDPSLLWMLAPITAPSTMLSVVQAPNSQAPPLRCTDGCAIRPFSFLLGRAFDTRRSSASAEPQSGHGSVASAIAISVTRPWHDRGHMLECRWLGVDFEHEPQRCV